jgi:hypothetical protein
LKLPISLVERLRMLSEYEFGRGCLAAAVVKQMKERVCEIGEPVYSHQVISDMLIDDLKQWKLNTFTSAAPGGVLGSLRLASIADNFDREVPREGWLHFRAEQVSSDLIRRGSLRLVAHTLNSAGHGDFPASWRSPDCSIVPEVI